MFKGLGLNKQDKTGVKEVFKQRGLELSKSRWPDPRSMPSEETMMSELLGKSKGSSQFKMLWNAMGMNKEDYREVVSFIRAERLKEAG